MHKYRHTKQAQAYTSGDNSSSTQILAIIFISQTPGVVLFPIRETCGQGHLLGLYAEVSTRFNLRVEIVTTAFFMLLEGLTHPEFLFKLFLNPFCDMSKFDLTIAKLWSCRHKQQRSSSEAIPAQQRTCLQCTNKYVFFIKQFNL